ncbi:MAG: RnfABCDGE type electron transport complex subunit D [Ruminococcaceae bacterium]|nr:RnfABCDGE type electron transport complex subunit D [Oscillospiraceae bacterium]
MNTMYVSVSPHLRSERNTQKIMLDVLIALVPALIASVILFGFRALLLVCVSAAACVLCEFIWEKCMKMEITVGDLSAVVTGVLLAYNVPVDMPLWQLIVGDIAAIIGVKMLFGGLGCNFMNPALVGRIVIMFSFTTPMTTYAVPKVAGSIVSGVDAVTTATPLAMLDQLDWSNFTQLLLGMHGGVIGEVCVLALLLGGIYLVIRKVIKPIIPLCYMASLVLFSWLFGGTQPVLSLFTGGVMLGSIFMATDYVTSPITNKGKVVFGIGCGFITAAIRVFGNYAEGVTFAILLLNILVPYINDLTMNKPLGGAVEK